MNDPTFKLRDGIRRPAASWAFALVGIGWAVVPLVWTIRRPYRTDDIRGLAQEFERRAEPGAPIYL